MGASVKLFGTSRMKDGKVNAYVAPVMIGNSHPLCSVNDVFNGIMVRGKYAGGIHGFTAAAQVSFRQPAL